MATRTSPPEQTPDNRREAAAANAVSGTASYLLERRAMLDRALRVEDRSAMSRIMRRTPPVPVALLVIQAETVRARFHKILHTAHIDVEEISSPPAALARLAERVHALLITDQLDLVHEARQLQAGAATHILFIDRSGVGARRAFRAGASECLAEEPRGEEFWARFATAHRIVSLASSLQLALTDNRVLSTIDELTRCACRRFFEHEFPREVERAARLARPLVLVMCDIDHFKLINDEFGHDAGDQVLREFADRLGQGLRLTEDWVARFGGEEFAIVLPEVTDLEGQAVAERLRQLIASSPFVLEDCVLKVTASFGVAGLAGLKEEASGLPRALVRAADVALYESKHAGRNRVTAAAEVREPRSEPEVHVGTHRPALDARAP